MNVQSQWSVVNIQGSRLLIMVQANGQAQEQGLTEQLLSLIYLFCALRSSNTLTKNIVKRRSHEPDVSDFLTLCSMEMPGDDTRQVLRPVQRSRNDRTLTTCRTGDNSQPGEPLQKIRS